MEPKDLSHDADSHRTRSPIKVAAILLGICIAWYLALAEEVHIRASPDAAAASVLDSSAPSATATTSTSAAGVGESSPSDSPDQVWERTDNSRECQPSVAIGTD